jgi:hypothetical protein
MKTGKPLTSDKQQLMEELENFQALEKAVQEQIRMLEGSLGLPPQINPTPAVPLSLPAPRTFHAALGGHLLTRLTDLEAASGYLVDRAIKADDPKITLRAIQVSVRIMAQVARLAEKHPHLTEGWQPPDRKRPEAAPATPQPRALEPRPNAPATPTQPPVATDRQITAPAPVVKKVSEDGKGLKKGAAGQEIAAPRGLGKSAPIPPEVEELLLAAVNAR